MRVNTGIKIKNRTMANKGQAFEEEVILTNEIYRRKGTALIQKISTPWTVIRKGKQIVNAFPNGKSTLDFRGTIYGGFSISFDCKESENEKGLPLSHIQEHQIEYIRDAIDIGEVSFILCLMKKQNKRYLISGKTVLQYWDHWQKNKGKRNVNFIPVEVMKEVKSREGIILDYLNGLEEII